MPSRASVICAASSRRLRMDYHSITPRPAKAAEPPPVVTNGVRLSGPSERSNNASTGGSLWHAISRGQCTDNWGATLDGSNAAETAGGPDDATLAAVEPHVAVAVDKP